MEMFDHESGRPGWVVRGGVGWGGCAFVTPMCQTGAHTRHELDKVYFLIPHKTGMYMYMLRFVTLELSNPLKTGVLHESLRCNSIILSQLFLHLSILKL